MKRRFHILVVTVLTFVMVVNGFFIGGKSDAVWANDLSVESLVNNETGMTVSVEADFVIENGVLKQYNGTA